MAIQAAKVTVGCMSPCDELGIVTFSTKVSFMFPYISIMLLVEPVCALERDVDEPLLLRSQARQELA